MAKHYKVLVITNLYPNAVFPRNGIFSEHRMRSMLRTGRVDLRIMSPVPWFPFRSGLFGNYAAFARVPKYDVRRNIHVIYPRFPVIPKIGMAISALLLALALIRPIRKLQKSGFEFDVIDAYYFYPDGVAAALLSKWFRKPVVITAYGNDLSLVSRYALPRWQIKWAASAAAGVTTVCQALKDRLIELGQDKNNIRVILHGVDLELFRPPQDRRALRESLGLKKPTIISVGHLIERKGHNYVIEALKELPDVSLLIAGDGEEESALRALASKAGVEDRVKFLGHVDQNDLPKYYGAADALVLASSREGIANVLLEAMACGTPVIATNVWGAPEVITDHTAGVLIPERTAAAVANGVRQLLEDMPAREDTRKFVEKHTWEQTAAAHIALFDETLTSE